MKVKVGKVIKHKDEYINYVDVNTNTNTNVCIIRGIKWVVIIVRALKVRLNYFCLI